ncbi:copper resistance CopC/CopD family protein [Staphylococcus cohnii]|uniref:Copper resistance protein CopC n=1 Tax=Staphylococcus cohnii TaxID=29382 RepID=A0A2T4LU04_9STAP|nr:copper resistance protein CopC [Staphylococcus cohnii]MBA1390317.1 copper resistance protein CopC [Staphylococcus cohnii]MCE5032925.1 copper resistance protein CopC [Staphylococcus cohnii]PTF05356.1 copper resistance protein CopC [Staphylococcus cohnii]PTF21180.1 copper resistance protein CopC [Staphylococcus cohnii]
MQLTFKIHKFSYVIFIISLIIGVVIFSQQVSAHATLEKVTPTQNSVVDNAPNEITLQFNEPVHAKYSSIQIYDDKGSEITEVKPSTTGSSQTLTFPIENLNKGTHSIHWHTMSADGHEINDSFEFSVGKQTANGIDTAPPFYEQADFWFGVTRFILEGLLITLTGFYLVNALAKRQRLPHLNLKTYTLPTVLILVMTSVITVLIYMMTLSSDIVSDVLSLQKTTLLQTPFILTMVAVIILLLLFTLKNMATSWYIFIPSLILITLSMSGHAWSQSIPIWSIFIRVIHIVGISFWLGALIYLTIMVLGKKQFEVIQMRPFLLKVNISAVMLIVISGVLMSIDQTNVLSLWQNIQTWTVLLLVKVLLTIVMMTLGFYQTTRALGKHRQTNRYALIIELSIGILLILAGVMMSQLNIPG